MRAYRLEQFGLQHLELVEIDEPRPGPGEILLDVAALSLNYRDLMVVKGAYNPKLELPVTPISDGAGVVVAVGEGVTRVRAGDRVTTHFVADWIDGPFRGEYVNSTLGTPGPGLAAEMVALPAEAVVPVPDGWTLGQAATLPIAALTAWSALVTVGQVRPGYSVLTLGTGGVSIFALQIAKALGAVVIITSSSDEKLQRARDLGADHTINYMLDPAWERKVVEITQGRGVDVVVETGGAGTLDQSMQAARAGGTIALLGALTGVKAEVTTGLILMKRLVVAGVMVDSRKAFADMNRFLTEKSIRPVIGNTFSFSELPQALRHMESGGHFGKIVVEM